MKIVFATPTVSKPHPAYVEALEKSIPVLDAAGIEHGATAVVGSAYISWARAEMAARFLKTDADYIVYLDHDVSWQPEDLLKLLAVEGDVIAGLYRFKEEPESYMGALTGEYPVVREDGCIQATAVPAGFLRISRAAIEIIKDAHPELCFGPEKNVDLFNHGAHNGLWWGEDYAFSRRWTELGGEIWVVPDLSLTHHGDKPYPGNYHEFLLRRGSQEAA